MVDTAQPVVAAETDPNVQLDQAADAFKAFLDPSQPRDEAGRFASPSEDESDDEIAEAEEPAADEVEDDEAEVDDEAEHEAADEAQPLPPSWPAEQAEQWAQLPADVQSFLTTREAERERTLNTKFQESANARKEFELSKREADAKRSELLEALGTVEALYNAPEPNPRDYGYGTQQYNEAAYNAAVAQWHQNARVLAQLQGQRDTLEKDRVEAEEKSFKAWKEAHEAEYWPKFAALAPELKEPDKAAPFLRGLVEYAVANGIPADSFDEGNRDTVTSAQLAILTKAQRYDALMAKQAKPKPKAPGPAVKPGVSSPRSAQKATRFQKANDRLAREGTVEAAAAVFKHLM